MFVKLENEVKLPAKVSEVRMIPEDPSYGPTVLSGGFWGHSSEGPKIYGGQITAQLLLFYGPEDLEALRRGVSGRWTVDDYVENGYGIVSNVFRP